MRLRTAPGGPGTPGAPYLVFLHIPKTGGKTVAAILHHHYGDAFRGGIGADAETPAEHRIPNAFSRVDRMDARVRQLAANPSVRAVAAHITFGVRDRFPPEARWLTVLRDPVERTLSQYHFLLPDRSRGRVTGRGFVPPWLPPPTSELTLAECLGEAGYIPDNLQTRMLCGLVSPHDPMPQNALEQAMRNLGEQFAFVGTTERLPEFLALLNVAFGWPSVAYKRSKYAGIPQQRKLLPPDFLRVVEERNTLDRELYRYAEGLFDRALMEAGPELQAEIDVLARAERTRRERERGDAADGIDALRALPLSARVDLALKEADLAEARLQVRRLRSRIKWRLGARQEDHDLTVR